MSAYHFTDSHAHLFNEPLGDKIDIVVENAQKAGVKTIVNICIDEKSLNGGMQITKRYPWIYNAGAVHPHDVEKEGIAFFPLIEEHAKKGSFNAIGETGLDYHYTHSTPSIQQQYLRKHLQLALSCKLPVIIHCRDAFVDLFQILDEEYRNGEKLAPAVLHCFTGNMSEATKALNRDLYISLSGIVTFKKSTELREIARMIPLNRLLIETDAPFLAPQSKRGHPNEPAFVVEVALVVAAVKGITLAEVAEATTANAKNLFSIF